MFGNFNVDWKEALILFSGLVFVIFLYYFFNRKSIAKEDRTKKLIRKKIQASSQTTDHLFLGRKSSPQILQAYERLTILMERIDLHKLVHRVPPISDLKQDYAQYLIQNIDQEFDFNVSQQIYVTEEAWALIQTAKNTVVQEILKTALKNHVYTAADLQRELLRIPSQNSVNDIAKSRLRKEVLELV